jgi:hypothetical protein
MNNVTSNISQISFAILPVIGYNKSGCERKEAIQVGGFDPKVDEDWTICENCDHTPNAETIAAFEEGDQLFEQFENGTIKSKTIDELFAELGI